MTTLTTKPTASLHRLNPEAKRRPILAASAAVLLVACAATSSSLQAATIVTAPGVTVTFDTEPAPTEWSTFTDGGAAGDTLDAAALDARVSGFAAFNIIDQILPSFASPRAAGAATEYDATALNIQTRPTSVGTHVLMATLENGSGAAATNLELAYDLGVNAPLAEVLPGHRVYFSLDGIAWTNIPEISGIGTAGRLSTSVNLTNWANGSQLFLLWVDDNGSSSPDTGYSLDTFLFAAAGPVIIGRTLTYNRSHTAGGAPNGSLQAGGGAFFLDGATPTAFAANDIATFSQNGDATIAVPADITTAGVVVSHTTGTYTIGGAGRIRGALTKSNAGTVIFTSANNFIGSTISGGTVETQAGALGTGAVNMSGGALWKVTTAAQTQNGSVAVGTGGATIQTDSNLTAGGLDGTDALTKTGTSTLTFNGGGTGTGGINVQAGRLALAGAVGGAGQTITLNGNPLDFVNTGDFVFSDAATARTINFGNAGVTISVIPPNNPGNPGGVGAILGDSALVGTGTITKAGNGALRVRGDHPSLASNWIVAAGTLESGAFPTALGTGTVTVNGPAAGETIIPTLAGQNTTVPNAVTLSGGNLGTRSGDLSDFTGAINVTAPSGVALNSFTTPANPQSIVISGVLSGTGDLAVNSTVNTVLNTKALVLTNSANTYTGAMTVGAGAGLAGTGITRGSVSVSALGILSPGGDVAIATFGPGTLSIGGNLALTATAVFSADISGADPAPTAGTDYDQVVVGTGVGPLSTGSVNLDGSDLVLTLGFGVAELNDLFFIIVNDGIDPVAGTFNNLPQGSTVAAGFPGSETFFFISYNANSTTGTFVGGNDVALTPIPEPASAGLLFLGSALLFRRRRKS